MEVTLSSLLRLFGAGGFGCAPPLICLFLWSLELETLVSTCWVEKIRNADVLVPWVSNAAGGHWSYPWRLEPLSITVVFSTKFVSSKKNLCWGSVVPEDLDEARPWRKSTGESVWNDAREFWEVSPGWNPQRKKKFVLVTSSQTSK